jgi:uncharacterized caspase-like protein
MFALGFLLCALLPVNVQAEPRIALIVGNGGYSSVTSLDNPVSDAELMAKTLELRGFEVTLLTDATQITLNRGIAQFGRDLRAAGTEATGLFYYAGHGVQSFGSNYLLPVDASLTDAADLGLVAVQANTVLRQMFSAKNKTNIFILDACRNNPFEDIRDLNDNGLAEMKAPVGTFLSYATAPGAVALDGLDGNSPFTKALAKQIPMAGVPIEKIFKNVRVEVIEKTNGQQTPWDTSSLTGDFFFEATEPVSADELSARALWDSVKDTRDAVQVMLFMRGFPDSALMPEAQALLAELMNEEVASNAAAQKVEQQEDVAEPESQVVAGDEAAERELIGVAQASGNAADYQAYLDVYPTGIFAELAAFELDIIAKKQAQTTEVAKVEPEPEVPVDVTFEGALVTGGDGVMGSTIAQLVLGSPMFAPFEGLPDELWKDQNCSNCHEWNRDALCTQGKTYLKASAERALSKSHPYGGGFKQNVRAWAANDCK